jgi:hypothetical protein
MTDVADKNTDGTPKIINIPGAFKLALLVVFCFSILSLAVSLYIAFLDSPGQMQKDLFSMSTDIYKMGFSAVVGLLGGKAL